MKINQILCDGCAEPIDADKPFIDLNPVRGGYAIIIKTETGRGETRIARDLNFHHPDCVRDFLVKLAREVKPADAVKITSAAQTPDPKP